MKKLYRYFLSIGMLWKLQAGFFAVALVTTIIIRILSYRELENWLLAVSSKTGDSELLSQLDLRIRAYIFDSIWQAGLEFSILFLCISLMGRMLINPIKSLGRALEKINKGDLTVKVEKTAYDEVGELESNFNQMQNNLCEIICDMDKSIRSMTHSSFQIKTLSKEIAKTSQNEENHSQEVVHATGLLKETTASVMKLTGSVAELTEDTDRHASEGTKKIMSNIDEMELVGKDISHAAAEMVELNETASKSYSIIDKIRDIADKTNMLALNASIEAARAGKSGRGFAIVADEVMKLAASTRKSADEITATIGALTRKTEEAATLMHSVVEKVCDGQKKSRETAEEIATISRDISESASFNRDISELTKDQMEQLESLQERIEGLFSAFKTNASKSKNTSLVGDNIFEVTKRLKQNLSTFTFRHKPEKLEENDDRRAHHRYDNHLRIVIEEKGKREDTICRDISMGGLSIITNDKYTPESKICVSIYLPYSEVSRYEKQNPLKLRGKVCWQKPMDGRNVCGISFEETDDKSREMIQACINHFTGLGE